MPRLSVLFFGMEGVFSRAPLAALLAAGHDVRAVVVPRSYALPGVGPAPRILAPRRHGLTLQLAGQPTAPSIVGMAWDAGIPALEIGRLGGQDIVATLAAYAPDVICVACFPYLLPPRLLAVPRHGGFNVHPSLLPAYRGPSPLFWVYRDGLEHAGVTIHHMDAGADTGDIAAQRRVEITDGTRYGDAELLLSRIGGEMLADVLEAVATEQLRLRPQPTSDAPTAPTPSAADYAVETTWSARRAYIFIHGLAAWGQPFAILGAGDPLVVRDAAGYDAHRTLPAPTIQDGGRLAVRFSPGVVSFDANTIEDYPRG
ncbi:MAG: formyltransferase family protein [Anaerolineae bacterium]